MAQIVKIECIPVSFPLTRSFTMSGAVIDCIYSVILKLHSDEGVVGVAETGDISPWYIGESQDSIIALITQVYGPRFLLGQDPCEIEKIVAGMDAAVRHNNQSKAVVDFALHDLKAKLLGVPVYELLGGLSFEKIPLMKVIGAESRDEMVEEAVTAMGAGFKSVKLKVGAFEIEEDVENVKAVREALPDVSIMLDANAGWDYFRALNFLRQVEQYNITMMEQPIPWWDIDGLARLRRKQSTPIFADESAAELSQVLTLIKREAIDGFMIKIAKAGGYLKAQKYVTLAQVAGLPVTSGCFKGSGIESAVQAHFLAAVEWMGRMEQGNLGPLENHEILDTVSVDITTDYVKKLPRYEDGYVYPPSGVGLGIELNEDVIANSITKGKQIVVIEK